MTFEEILMEYALPVACMAAIVMVLVGIVKIFTKCTRTSNSKLAKVMSYIYVILSLVFTVGVVCAYYTIFKIELDIWNIAIDSGKVFACTQALYPIYRDYGGRWLLSKFCNLFKGKNADTDRIIAAIQQVIVLNDNQKAKITEKLNKDL